MKDISRWRNRYLTGPEPIEADYSHSTETDEVELRHYLSILIKRRRLLTLVFLTVVIIGAYFSFTATPLYQASAVLKIEPQNPSVTGVGEMLRLESNPQYDYYQTQFALLRSNTLAAKVISDLKLESNKLFTSTQVKSSNPADRVIPWVLGEVSFIASLIPKTSREETTSAEVAGNAQSAAGNGEPVTPNVEPGLIARYGQFLEVKPLEKTRLVQVAFSTPDRALSQQLANAHARSFIRLSVENRFELTKEARDFLDGKNAELKQKLERSEEALNRFRQTHGVVSMEKGENFVVERLADFNRQLTTARAQRIEAESLYKVVENKSTQSLSQVMNQGMVPALRSNLLALEAEKVKLASIFKPDHPRMIELNQQIGEMKGSLNTEISNVVRGIQESYFAARSKEQALEAEAQKQQQAALNLKEVGVQYAVLEEEVKVNRALYEGVLKRLSETNISNDNAVSNMQITQSAERPSRAFTPNIPLNVLVSALAGLCLGVGLAFVRECLDSSLNTPEHVWRAVALNTLGVIPDMTSLSRRFLSYHNRSSGKFLPKSLAPSRQEKAPASKELIVSHHPLSIVAESYRSIRTALLFSQPEKPPEVILLTSPSPGEGKTVTTLNLAIALAQDGHNVLVVDADLRKGCCHARLGITNHRGLSNVLTGNLPLEEAVQATSISGLSLLSRGICPPNPTDLLGSQKMRQMLRTLRESFNFILIDSPPAIAMSDAAVLSVLCDGVLLVFHGKKTTTASARQAMERLDAVRAPFLGAILNSINLGNPAYAYYRRYASYYHVPNVNGADDVDEEEAMDSDENTDRLSNIRATAEARKGEEDVDKNGGEKGERNRSRGVMNGQNSSRSAGEINKAVTFELPSAVAADSPDKSVKKRTEPASPVSRQFMNRLMDVFMESVGPVAPLIVRHHIGLLGESQDAFPKSRIDELVKVLTPEISHPEIRLRFQKKIAEEIQNLEN